MVIGIRVGHGYDAHRLVEGRKLILGGVNVPFDKGLLGHSDADVLAHAVMDALLGAAGHGDLGQKFPDSDPQYEDMSSLKLLWMVGRQVEAAGWQVENIDTTIVAQAPRLSGFLQEMAGNLAGALGLVGTSVNVKATTEEGLGFTGTGQGIAAHAVCLLSERRRHQ